MLSTCNGFLLQLASLPDVYTGLTYPVWSQELARTTYVDVVAILLPFKGAIHISILNRHPTATWQAPLVIPAEEFTIKQIEIYSIFNQVLHAKNTFEKPDLIVPERQIIDAKTWQKMKGVLSVKPHSWCLMLFKGEMVV